MAMNLSGVTMEQKKNIAVALHLKKISSSTKDVYNHKDDDPTAWRLYPSWVVLQETIKIRLSFEGKKAPEVDVDVDVDVDDDWKDEANNNDEKKKTDDNDKLGVPDNDRYSTNAMKKENVKSVVFSGRDRAKRAIFRDEILTKRSKSITELVINEKTKAKAMLGLHDQAKVRNMRGLLQDPFISAEMKKKLMAKIEQILELDDVVVEPVKSVHTEEGNDTQL
jgi:hypothetical protein